ncbi:PadR family transcriptional regulator [Geomicrobium sediminis]|uniref:PadR family transcriptional regulator PadR n=1 Tax=Geomicrobium sediminis TaxID=1347788 RepID=A0ABS2PBZ7_9BACL|nr:PadR family transcriptional regulator [Geomicrobium sediminis]MBM7632944.1 PadR family transcriptional regulator PadR [Geomicrobium sediminis]
MNAQWKKGILELCVLLLISNKDRYGYELVEEISKKFTISEGGLYPLLRRMTKDELFSTYLAESKEGPPRKYYAITEKGEEMKEKLLHDWNDLKHGVNQFIQEEVDQIEKN